MNNLKMDKKDISMRMIIITSFIILMLVTASLVGYTVFSNWLSSTDEMIIKMAQNINSEIYSKIERFIHIPENINDINQKLLENGVINLKDENDREKFFVGILKSHSNDVYSFSYGTETGEYYGARRNEENVIEIMRNNEDTGWNSWYYSVSDEMTAKEKVVEAGKFDPRTRDWYKVAKENKGPVFSPIYKHFVMDDLTVSVSSPVYNEMGELEGVLGTHITLSKIDNYLHEVAKDENAYALIVERNSGKLVANSFNMKNFTTLKDGSVKRLSINEIDNGAITKAYKDYINTDKKNFKIKSDEDKLNIHLTEYNKEGLDWVVITAVPNSYFTSGVKGNIKSTVIIILVALTLSILIYLKLSNKFISPIYSLIKTTEKFSQGDLTQRATIVRNDEIGKISKAFNNMADIIVMLINNLESKVKERTLELEEKNKELKENKDQLQLILDSTVEAIYGLDIEGKCTFCNASGLKMLGYSSQEELLGKDIHLEIHHTYKDGRDMPLNKCKIYRALLEKKGTHSDDEVFWRKNGTCFDVEYNSYPQFRDGEIVGAVVTFVDNTERKKSEERIKYLSYHDSLTGLYNRMYFQDELKRLDTRKNLPLSIIFGDVNGLKLTNDIFGHVAGDELLKKSAEIIKRVCREEDVVARVGGDEFAIILPNTEAKDADKIMNRIKDEFSKEKIVAIKGSISLGYETKVNSDENIESTMEKAEQWMYKEKMLSRKNINSQMVETIIETLHNKSIKEKNHSISVSELCESMGKEMNMSETEVRKLKDAGFLHDIGKIILEEELLNKEDKLTDEENKKLEQHSVIGFRILNLFDDTLDLADGVLNHHESWDGSGYPKGLKGKEIPKIARIIRVVECYHKLTDRSKENSMSKEEALEKIQKQSDIMFDPEIVDVFIKMMK